MPDDQPAPATARGTPAPLPPEPLIRLPTVACILASTAGAFAMAAAWTIAGLVAGHPLWIRSGLIAAGILTAVTVPVTLATVPWMAKPASTAGLLWLAASAVRGVASIGLAFLLYSAPPFGWSEDLAKGATPFLLAVATGFLVALLLEVAVIARHVLRATAHQDTARAPGSDPSAGTRGDPA